MSSADPTTDERVVLLAEDGTAIGTAAKVEVHHAETPLHLAFSCYVFDTAGRLLLSQRAHSKRTWPGVWTNSACGHPAPGESLVAAVRRRVPDELGLAVSDVRLVLPAFRYRAEMADGTVENEMCPVFTARCDGEPHVDPAEVEATEWVSWPRFRAEVLAGRREVSPWCVEQVRLLDGHPLSTDPGRESDLPEAARR